MFLLQKSFQLQKLDNMQPHRFKYLGLITCLYITFQLVSDVSAGKLITLLSFPVSVTVLFFPFTYIFSDILTEVYGYSRARSVLWIVMVCSVIAGLIYSLVAWLPAINDPDGAYTAVLGQVPRILIGGWLAVFAGDIANNYTLAKMKIWTGGKHLWTRTITSTFIGQLVNTTVFYVVALYGKLPDNILFQSIMTGWLLKTAVEIVFTPLTYFVVNKLKTAENSDVYDTDTNFNPLIIKTPF